MFGFNENGFSERDALCKCINEVLMIFSTFLVQSR